MASESEDHHLADVVQKLGNYGCSELLTERQSVIKSLEDIINQWAKELAGSDQARVQLLPFGGQQVGAVTKDSDIDTVCLVPRSISRKDFFRSLPDVFEVHEEIRDIRLVEAAYVPVINLIFKDIHFDICFARLLLDIIPEDLDINSTDLLEGMDIECIRSLCGVRETQAVMKVVPNYDIFLLVVKSIKLWAKNKHIYGTAFGYLGGIAWTIMAAYCCRKHKRSPASEVLQQFFYCFAHWQWPQPLLLHPLQKDTLKLKSWNPQTNIGDFHHIMPIITPIYPEHNCAFNVSQSTKSVLTEQLLAACTTIDAILDRKSRWEDLFAPRNFFSEFKHFILVTSKALTQQDHLDWGGLVEAKIRILGNSIEEQESIKLSCPHTKRFYPLEPLEGVFQSLWFIGLQFDQSTGVKLDLAECIQHFSDTLVEAAKHRGYYRKGMKIEVKHVKRKQLGQFISVNEVAKP